MFKTIIIADDDILDAIQDTAKTAPRRMKREYRKVISRTRSQLLNKLKQVPGSPKYPIRWKTPKQRRAFFATDGFGKGIPTRRNNKMVNAWQVNITGTDYVGVLEVVNPVNYEQYVTGIFQQPFHQDTGWGHSQDDILDAAVKFEAELIETWYKVAAP